MVTVTDPDAEAKKLIEQAYRDGNRLGLAVWCEDEAGPYPGHSATRSPVGNRSASRSATRMSMSGGGTAKLLTLFHPATGQVRVKGVTRTPNTVLHPWLQAGTSGNRGRPAAAGRGARRRREPGHVGALAGRTVGSLHPAGRSATLR
ncbi:MAG: hypothetical protein MZW92_09165 [Comamonadaceae bacterium]|nr:hypothetical protein [Comamonadaceae bacterium]